jgi:hypothetical protein
MDLEAAARVIETSKGSKVARTLMGTSETTMVDHISTAYWKAARASGVKPV